MKSSIMMSSIVSLFIILWSCTPDEVVITPPPVVIPPEYQACCGAQDSTVYAIGDAWITVPNVFTPNGDGVNDRFYPKRSSDSIGIWIFAIYDTIYDPNNSPVLIHSLQGFTYDHLDVFAWKGKKRLDDGIVVSHKGRFKYKIIFFYKGEGRTAEGQACVIACDDDAKIFSGNSGCIFESQINSETLPDSSLPPGEEACFGN